jgi:hypothetical protein
MEISIPKSCIDFDEQYEIDFYRILFQLGKLDASYLSYVVERPDGRRVNFFSDKEWLDIYQKEGFLKTCQLTRLSRYATTSPKVISWVTLQPATKDQKKVIDARTDFDIANGITISQNVNGTHEMVALGTRRTNANFVEILYQNKAFLEACLKRLRQLAIKSNSI